MLARRFDITASSTMLVRSFSTAASAPLAGQVAAVTGAATGLGLGMATKLAQSGATVMIGDVQEDVAKQAAAKLRSEGLDVTAHVLDVSQSSSVDAFFAATVEQHGGLDVSVSHTLTDTDTHRFSPGPPATTLTVPRQST